MDDDGSDDFRQGKDDNSSNIWTSISTFAAFKAH
jgi:hypothetical protein